MALAFEIPVERLVGIDLGTPATAPRVRRRFRLRALALLVGAMLLGSVVTLGAVRVTAALTSTLQQESLADRPVTPDLPREWRWERKPITFDHMFREKR